MTFDSIQRGIEEFRAGRMVVVVDDEDRENEGDLCIAAELIKPADINFMATHARGLICLALTEQRLRELDLPMMVEQNQSTHNTAFTVSIEAREGVTTGISAHDRAHTIRVAVADATTPGDLIRPGHVFPLRARSGGVLVRTGHTEAVVDLARLAGLKPAGVICEIMNPDGTMARLPELVEFARAHGLAVISIADLIQYRVAHEPLVRRLVVREVAHRSWGDVTLIAYGTTLDHRQHLAVIKGDLLAGAPPLVRVHSGYPLSSVLGDIFSEDRGVLNAALRTLAAEQRGVLLCLDQGDPPVALTERLRTLDMAQGDAGSVERIQREIGIGAQILRELGLTHLRLLTNHPRRLKGLEGYGLHVDDVLPLDVEQTRTVVSKLQVVR